uniref:Fungal lipase-like domain-containing protein n=1 Tax=Oryza punctata TaxID=4537 RepID=A0A0E0LLI9_ORYPU
MKDRSNPLAPAWWKSFGFRCRNVIKDDSCVSVDMDASDQDDHDEIFGATYKYEPPAGLPRHPSAPSYVVAFQGTIPTHLGDLIQDIKIVYNTFCNSKRCEITREEVEVFVDGRANSCTVWLAGHSLGASRALDVGRSMAEKGFNLPTFLFNPSQVSPASAINLLRPNEKAKRHLYAASSFLKVGLSKIVKSTHEEYMANLFERLSPWMPELVDDDAEDHQSKCKLLREAHCLKKLVLKAHSLEQWWKPDSELSLTKTRLQAFNLLAFLFNLWQVPMTQAINFLRMFKKATADQCAVSYRVKAMLDLVTSSHMQSMADLFQRLSPYESDQGEDAAADDLLRCGT